MAEPRTARTAQGGCGRGTVVDLWIRKKPGGLKRNPTIPTITMSPPEPIQLVFSGLPPALLTDLEAELNGTKGHPFLGRQHVEVLRCPEGLVFRLDEGKGGYSFCRHNGATDTETFRNFLQDPIQSLYMPITYEIKERSDEVVVGILERYQAYGVSHAAKIDWMWHQVQGRNLLIMRVPKEIVQAMIHRQGGTLSTQVRGPVAVLRALPVLGRIVPEDAKDGEVMHRAFVTPYTASAECPDAYDQCMTVHQAAVREVIEAAGSGITIGPVARWTP
jgi:hypothetical protein